MNLIEKNKKYYEEMLKKDRLIPFIYNGRLVAFITFYITDDEFQYINSDPWVVQSDILKGNICYISQLLTDKHTENPKLSYKIWYRFKSYIKNNFKSVKYIKWRRYDKKNKNINSYIKEI